MSEDQNQPEPELPKYNKDGVEIGKQVPLAVANRQARLSQGNSMVSSHSTLKAVERDIERTQREIGAQRSAANADAKAIVARAEEEAKRRIEAADDQARAVRVAANDEANNIVQGARQSARADSGVQLMPSNAEAPASLQAPLDPSEPGEVSSEGSGDSSPDSANESEPDEGSEPSES